jgi:hypothetical protein
MGSIIQVRRREARRRRWLDEYRASGNVYHACRRAGVSRSVVYEWRASDPAFAAAMDEAGEEATDLLEEEARRRAVDGVERLVFGRDGRALVDPRTGSAYVERRYSDALLICLLKARRPRVYRDHLDATADDRPLAKAYVGIDFERV